MKLINSKTKEQKIVDMVIENIRKALKNYVGTLQTPYQIPVIPNVKVTIQKEPPDAQRGID